MQTILQKVIQNSERQAISYSEFMELVLYHPQKGYYMTEKQKIGRDGDFFTSSNVSAVFAKQFAHFFMDFVKEGAVPPVICELGGGTGRFAHTVLTEWQICQPHVFSELQYIIVETSPYHRNMQRNLLSGFSNVVQYASLDELPSELEGIVFANELYDAFPVEVIEKHDNKLYEIYIKIEKNELTEELYPLENKRIEQYLQRHSLKLHDEQRFEVPLFMSEFVHRLSGKLSRAILVTVDYGYTNEEWLQPQRRGGSLRGYYNHQLITNPLLHPGKMDITAHIHWDELQFIGKLEGIDSLLLTKQRSFLLASGILHQLVNHEDRNPFSEVNKQNRAIRSFIMNGGISDSFHVLLQQKGLPELSLKNFLDFSLIDF